jgi:putative serine protease PepD
VQLGVSGEGDKGGAKLTAIVEDGPAAKAGLKAGDLVTAIDGKPLNSYDELLDTLVGKKPDDVIKLTVVRAKAKKDEKKDTKADKKDEAKKDESKKDAKADTESLTSS